MTSTPIPSPPENCACGNPVVLLRIEVFHPRGHIMTGSFLNYGSQDGTHHNLERGYRFKRWIPQCIPCMQQELAQDQPA